MHPGFHVALELIFWLACTALTGLVVRAALLANNNAQYIDQLLNSNQATSFVTSVDLSNFQGYAVKTDIAAGLFGALM
jgi:hypothetical protein